MDKQPKVVIYQRPDGKWGWSLIAANGRKVGPGGQGFATERNAKRAWATHEAIVHQVDRMEIHRRK